MSRYSNTRPQLIDGNDNIIVGGKKFFYETGTTTLKTVYSDSTFSTPQANPVLSDADGRFPAIFLDGIYREVQTLPDGVSVLWDEDPVGEITEIPNVVNTFESVTDMRASTTVGGLVRVDYHTDYGDSGGGVFSWNETSTDTDNNGTIFKLDTISVGRRERNFVGAIYTKWFNDRGDDTVDDSVAIQAAIDFAPNGGVVIITQGNSDIHRIGTTLTINKNLTLMGQNKNGTVLKWTGAAAPMITIATNTEFVKIQGLNLDNDGTATIGINGIADNIALEGIEVLPNVKFTQAAFSLSEDNASSSIKHAFIRDCVIKGGKTTSSLNAKGIEIPNGKNIIIERCVFEDNIIDIDIGGITESTERVAILNSYFSMSSNAGASGTGVLVTNSLTFTVRDSFFEMDNDSAGTVSGQRGIKVIKCDTGMISGCDFDGNAGVLNGIDGQPNALGVNVIACKFFMLTGYGVNLGGSANNWTIGKSTSISTSGIIDPVNIHEVANLNLFNQPILNVSGISAGGTEGRNLTGNVTFTGGTGVNVNFPVAEVNSIYEVFITPPANQLVWVDPTSKTTSGFVITTTSAATFTVSWLLIRA